MVRVRLENVVPEETPPLTLLPVSVHSGEQPRAGISAGGLAAAVLHGGTGHKLGGGRAQCLTGAGVPPHELAECVAGRGGHISCSSRKAEVAVGETVILLTAPLLPY